ncbi:N-acetyltransferase [Streptomyces sp. NPDC012825]|uniref:N-acetyltransferase n=1 Tax=Streptomyces sp. NPDC012825 TaxID=3364851 RepID=UPI0036BF3B12
MSSATDIPLKVASLAERPDLEEAMLTMDSTWPAYIRPDPVLVHWVFERHARFQLVVLDEEERVVARAASVPVSWDGTDASLPDTGWDGILRQCVEDTYRGAPLNTLCALEIAVDPHHKARRLSGRVLDALKEAGRGAGHGDMIAPVRPSGKHARPRLSMEEYVRHTREDGLPDDPWLRVHVRSGARVVKVCPVSMTISGSLDQWRGWTGLPLDHSGTVDVPGALSPLRVDTGHDHAVYIEPNVWVHHPLART